MFLVEERMHVQIVELLLLKSFLKILLTIAHLPMGMHIQVAWHASHASHFFTVVFNVQVIIFASATSHYVATKVCLTRARLVGKLPGRREISSHHVGHAGSSGKRKITARVWERVGLRSKGWKCMTGISGKDAGKSEMFFSPHDGRMAFGRWDCTRL